MNKINILIYLSNLMSTYTFMCKKGTQINKDVKNLNNHINDFKNNNFSNSELFINNLFELCLDNYTGLFTDEISENIKNLYTDIKNPNNNISYDIFFTVIKKDFNKNSTFTNIPLVEIPNKRDTDYINDVLIHQNFINTLSEEQKQELPNNPSLVKDHYIDRLSILNQAIIRFNEELNIDSLKENPPTIILSYDSKENIEYNGVLRKKENIHKSLIEITLKDEGLGIINHELFHLLEYEYTKIKYKNLGNQLISNVYYKNDAKTRDLLEKDDQFLRELKTFDMLNNNPISPVSKKDRLNIFDEFLKEHLEYEAVKYDINNLKDCNTLINQLFTQKNPNITQQQKLDFQNKINNYLTIKSDDSFFHIESLLYDKIVNESYSDKYSEKLARLSGMYFDEDYNSKPLPRGKEKQIYQEKFKKIATLLSNEIKTPPENKPNTQNNINTQIVLNIDKQSSMDKLKNKRITSTEKTNPNQYKM